ncbi:MAG: NYN domain-containing protein [Actinobacteria bacterium]|nr:NYN domain-containing protein [Actinomycetota bacterium]
MLGFRGGSLSEHATGVVIRVLDDDEAFREQVAAAADAVEVATAGRLFLQRPDGWRTELDRLVDAERERRTAAAGAEAERSAAQRVRGLERSLDELRRRLDAATAAAARAAEDLDVERARRRTAERDRSDLEQRVAAAEAGRARAVGELTAARSTAEVRLARVRELEAQVEALREGRDHWATPVLSGIDRAREALESLSEALGEVSSHVRRPPETGDVAAAAARDAGSSADPRRVRRTPVRLVRGAIDGTLEATDQLLRTPGVLVLVDGYNVSMAGWPHLDVTAQRASLQSMLATLVARASAEVWVVFDGDDDGRSPAVTTLSPVRVRYTSAGVEADDVLIAQVGEVRTDRPVVVVSSDRRVRDGVAAAGANSISSQALLEWCRR